MRGLVPVYDKDTKELLCVVDNLTVDEIQKICDDVTAVWVEADEQGLWFDAVDDSEKGLKARLQAEGAVVYDVAIDEVYF